jgi:hypothetical protein
MAAAADDPAAIAAALGLGEESEEESIDEEDPPLDEEAIAELRTAFRNSLVRVFGYTEVSATVIQDKLGLNEPVNLVLTWDSDSALESACNNLIRGANHYAVDDEVPVFRFSMSQDLILYREWVRLRLSRGLSAEAEYFMRKEQTFMFNWQRALRDIKESIRLSAKSESDVLKFDARDWTKWFKSADNFFRRTLGVRGVTLDWIYREEAYPKPGLKYPSIVAELKATILLEGEHFDEDSAAVYDVIAVSTLGTSGYSYVKKFEESRNGRLVMLALKSQFGGEAYDLARSNAANEVIRSATFSGPTRKYTYDQHVAKFEDAYNELALLGEPVTEASKVRLFCKSLKEKFMKASAIDTQMSKETASSFALATAHLKSVRDLHVADGADKEERQVSELGKRKGGGGGPKDKRKKKGGGAGGGLQLHGYSDKEWFDLPEATKAKVKAGRAAEKAAKRAASAASSAKTDDAEKDKDTDKGGVKFGKGAHA